MLEAEDVLFCFRSNFMATLSHITKVQQWSGNPPYQPWVLFTAVDLIT